MKKKIYFLNFEFWILNPEFWILNANLESWIFYIVASHSLITGVPGAGAADDPAVRKTIIPARGDMMRITDWQIESLK